jgi:hypothetical protein
MIILIFIVICLLCLSMQKRKIGIVCPKVSLMESVIIVLYETDLSHPNLLMYISELKKHNYNVKVLTDNKWVGFGRKINKVSEYLKTLHEDQLVIVSDARDVINTNFDASELDKTIHQDLHDIIQTKIFVSTEIACCVPPMKRFPPGSLRGVNGEVLKKADNGKEKKGTEGIWKDVFRDRATSHGLSTAYETINPNAGLYLGKAKTLLNVYRLMNASVYEDDQALNLIMAASCSQLVMDGVLMTDVIIKRCKKILSTRNLTRNRSLFTQLPNILNVLTVC